MLADSSIRGRVVDERGEPLAGWSVTGFPPRGKGNMASATTGADGRFCCTALGPVPYVFELHDAGDAVRARPAVKLWGIEPGGDELVVRVRDEAIPSATITGVLLDADGLPPAEGSVRCSSPALRSTPRVAAAADGRFRIGPLPPGTYRLQGAVGGDGRWRGGWGAPFTVGARATHDAGVVQMPVFGSIEVTATGPDGAPLDGASVAIEETTGWRDIPWGAGRLEDGRLRIEDVAPGGYRVRVGARDLPDVYAPVTVAAGKTAAVAMHVPAGVACELELSPVSEPVPIDVAFVIRRDGERYQRYTNRIEGQRAFRYGVRMLPGSYEIEATSETGRRALTRFVVTAGDAVGRRIAIRLP